MRRTFLALLMLLVVVPAAAQEAPKGRTILVLDASGSMWGQIEGQNKIVIAREVVGDLIADWDPAIHLGLTAYGHRRKGDCADIEALVPVGPVDAAALTTVVNDINPKGKTPLSAAVQQAAETLKYTEESATVILVTDGLETCDSDPCAVARSLEESGIDFTAHVVGFDLSDEESKQVQCVAENTGGQYFSAGNAGELRDALGTVVQTVQASVVSDTIHVVLAEGQAPLEKDSVSFQYFPISEAGKTEQTYVGFGYGPKGKPSLDPGEYFARVKLGSAIVDMPFTVEADERQEFTANLNAGRLRATARLDESAGQAEGNLAWNIYERGPDGKATTNKVAYAYNDDPGFVLPAGDYIVDVKLGAARASGSQTIEAGGSHEIVIDLRAGTVSYNAVLTEGADPYRGNMSWVARAIDEDGNVAEENTAYSYSRSGKFTLLAGKYQLRAKAGSIVRSVDIDVLPGEDLPVAVNLDGGTLNYAAVLTEGGARVGGSTRWRALAINDDGRPGEQIAYSYSAAGQFALPSGPVELQFKQGSVVVSDRLEIVAGQNMTESLVLNAGYLDFTVVDETGTRVAGGPGWKVYPIEDGVVASQDVGYGYSSKARVLLFEGAYELRVSGGGRAGSARFDVKAGETITITAETKPAE
ncbi:MAG: vWA domain-containing protein [Alphaproteobacteria bacterium]